MNALQLYEIAFKNKKDNSSCLNFCNFLFGQRFQDRVEYLEMLEMENFKTESQFLGYLANNF